MKFLKDFFYDKNDIILTIIILVLAGLLISWRLDEIMKYPATLAKETHTTVTTQEDVPDEESSAEEGSSEESSAEEEAVGEMPEESIWANGVLTQNVTVTVRKGSETSAVNDLIYAGLFDSYDEFAKVCKSVKRKPSQIKATSYVFEAGSSQADIAKQVTR